MWIIKTLIHSVSVTEQQRHVFPFKSRTTETLLPESHVHGVPEGGSVCLYFLKLQFGPPSNHPAVLFSAGRWFHSGGNPFKSYYLFLLLIFWCFMITFSALNVMLHCFDVDIKIVQVGDVFAKCFWFTSSCPPSPAVSIQLQHRAKHRCVSVRPAFTTWRREPRSLEHHRWTKGIICKIMDQWNEEQNPTRTTTVYYVINKGY